MPRPLTSLPPTSSPPSQPGHGQTDQHRLLAQVAAWVIEQGAPESSVAEAMRQTVIGCLLRSRHPGFEVAWESALSCVDGDTPGGLARDLVRAFSGIELATAAQRLLEWDVHESAGDRNDIPLPNAFSPLVLSPRKTHRRRRGSYFTPPTLVSHLVSQALEPWLDNPEALTHLTVMDPACGDGRFLVAVANRIWQKLEQPGRPDLELRLRTITGHLHGIDLDPVATCLARVALLEAAGSDVRAVDGLVRHITTNDALLVDPRSDGTRPAYDLVIGNPPFGSFSGRQAIPIHEALRRDYIMRWGCGGWESLHGLFLSRAMELSRHSIALVLPTQVTHLDGYQPLRDAVDENWSLQAVDDHGETAFEEDAVTPVVTLVARHGRAGSLGWNGRSTAGPSENGSWREALAERAESLAQLVGDPGVHTGNCARHLVSDEVESREGHWVPVLEGKQVGRWSCARPTKRLRIDYQPADGEYFGMRPLETYLRSRFVIRQTARFPIVGPRRHADHFRNSLLALFEPDNGYDVRYLVGLLNSQLIRFLYTSSVAESSQTTFPQVKVGSLRRLPLIWPDLDSPQQRASYETILESVSALLEVHEEKEEDSRCASWCEIENWENRIEEALMAIYDIGPEARDEINRSLAES